MKSALLVIDIQNSFKARPFWSEEGYAHWCRAQQALIDGCQRAAVPVVQIFHHSFDGGPFDPSSGLVTTLPEIRITPDRIIHKERHSALAGTPLLSWLLGEQINRLIISGMRTEQCCETTARHGSDLGLQIDFISEATHTFAMTHVSSGVNYSPAEIKARTELVLAGRFARILSVQQVLASLAEEEK